MQNIGVLTMTTGKSHTKEDARKTARHAGRCTVVNRTELGRASERTEKVTTITFASASRENVKVAFVRFASIIKMTRLFLQRFQHEYCQNYARTKGCSAALSKQLIIERRIYKR